MRKVKARAGKVHGGGEDEAAGAHTDAVPMTSGQVGTWGRG